MSVTVSLLGAALLGVLLAGYLAQQYLPAPTPRIAGIDLGTTYSSIGVHHAGTGEVEVIADSLGRKSIPSVVAFLKNGSVLVGHDAVAQAEHNPAGTIYDAKRFIGKQFSKEEFAVEAKRYPFQIVLQANGSVIFSVPISNKLSGSAASPSDDDSTSGLRLITPEEIGSIIIGHLRQMAEAHLRVSITRGVISVPAEFDARQRNATVDAAALAGIEILRVINEPTAAALAYGLHKKEGVEYVLIVDLGGGTLDVSLLFIQGGMFMTTAMAGNNHLGGQDFNQRMLSKLLDEIQKQYDGQRVTDSEDLQNLRAAIETAKLQLTYEPTARLRVPLRSVKVRPRHAAHAGSSRSEGSPKGTFVFERDVSRSEFEAWNADLFRRILRPIEAALADVGVDRNSVDEVVLVGGSTRIPKIRQIIKEFFTGREPNSGVDPDLAVVTGVAVQAGVTGGGWPLQVSATELPARVKKVHVYDDDPKDGAV
jgi:stress 70 chaperone-associated protein